ncbi:MAG TPA: hypothetical protein VMG98_10940 [Verrucomicrobiae bacterium]|nr:hypothetical protein [Verrucomicrobiae bacterium]
MLSRWALFLFGAAFVAVAGCGGGGKGAAPGLPAVAPLATASAPATAAKSRASFVITIPRATPTPLGAQRPAYVSPATQSMTISVLQGSTSVISQTVGLTASSSGCTSSLANITCTLTLDLSAGSYTASITTYDGASGSGNALSTAQNVSFTVVANQNNVVPLGLSGIPTKIIALAGNTANSVYVLAEDADGNFIVGSGAPTLTATKASGSAVASITQPTSTAPNTILFSPASPAVYGTETVSVTASYPSGQTNGCASPGAVCALATPISVTNSDGTAFIAGYETNSTFGFSLPLTSNTQSPSVTFGGLGYPYGGVAVSSSGTLFTWGYSAGSFVVSSPPYTAASVTNPNSTNGLVESYYQGAVAPNGDVFIPEFPTSAGALAVMSPPYTGAATTITTGIDGIYGVAADSNSNAYAANATSGDVTVYASPYTSVSATLTVTSAPDGIYVSGSKLYVLENGFIDVFNLPVTSSSTPAATLTMSGYSYSAAAVDSKGNLWVGCYQDCGTTSVSVPGYFGAVYEFTTPFSNGQTPSVTLTMPASGFSSEEPTGIGFDPSGNLYVLNYTGGLLEYSPPITAGSTPAYGIETSSFLYPFGMAIAPRSFAVTP